MATNEILPKGGLSGGPFDTSQVPDENTRALMFHYRWAPVSDLLQPATAIPFSFPQTKGVYSPEPTGFAVATDAQKDAVRTALELVASYTNLTFNEVSSGLAADATIRVARASDPSRAGPPETPGQGDTFLGTNGDVPAPVGNVAQFFGTDGFLTIMHELGHALGLNHGHPEVGAVGLAPNVNDNEFSVMTYASYLGSPPGQLPTDARAGSSPQSLMMYDIAALQAFYGPNFSKVGTTALYTWDSTTGQQSIDGRAAPLTGVTQTNKIFSTVWTQGAVATYDLGNFSQDQVDDLRPGHWLTFSRSQLADLNSQVAPGTAGFIAQGNVYNALLHDGDLRSAIANLITGSGNDTLIGNDRDNALTARAGNDIIHTNGGNDTVVGGSDADIIYFGTGRNILRDTPADLNGDVVHDFYFGAVDVRGALIGRECLAVTAQQTTLTVETSTVVLNGQFTGGEFLISQRGAGAEAHTAMAFVQYLPALSEGVAVNPSAINGIASQPFLTGDGTLHFTLDFRSAISAFNNQLGVYKVAADGTISDVHVLFANTLDRAALDQTIGLGVLGNGERMGFFLIQDGFDIYGALPDDLSFVLPGTGQTGNVDFWQPLVLQSATRGELTSVPVFHSFHGLNPRYADQVLSGLAPSAQELLIGFEDLPSASGDRDFQDIVIAVHFTSSDFRIL